MRVASWRVKIIRLLGFTRPPRFPLDALGLALALRLAGATVFMPFLALPSSTIWVG
jgi:hypothetical protein